MAKYIIGASALILVLIGAGYYFQNRGGGKASQQQEELQVQQPTTATYASSTRGFSTTYPTTFSVDEGYAYQGVPKKPIAGVKITIPGAMATGTNLSSDTYLSVEQLPRASACTGDIYIFENVKAVDMTIGSTTYSVASTTGAAAGNRYEEIVYALKGSKPCTAVRYYIHSTAIGNYQAGTVSEFDRSALISALDSIRNTLVLFQ